MFLYVHVCGFWHCRACETGGLIVLGDAHKVHKATTAFCVLAAVLTSAVTFKSRRSQVINNVYPRMQTDCNLAFYPSPRFVRVPGPQHEGQWTKSGEHGLQ